VLEAVDSVTSGGSSAALLGILAPTLSAVALIIGALTAVWFQRRQSRREAVDSSVERLDTVAGVLSSDYKRRNATSSGS
jgi:predicted Co/Zn/Cd cation transporter (cation efflux family)